MLLNYRDFDGWYKSCANTILAVKEAAMAGELPEDANRDGPSPELWGVIEKLIWQGDFQGNFKDRDWTRQMYYDRIEEIKAYVPEDRLVRVGARRGRLGADLRGARRGCARHSRSRGCTTRTSSGRNSVWSPCRRRRRRLDLRGAVAVAMDHRRDGARGDR